MEIDGNPKVVFTCARLIWTAKLKKRYVYTIFVLFLSCSYDLIYCSGVCVLFVSYEILFVLWAHNSRGRNDQKKQIMPIVVEIHRATYVLRTKQNESSKKATVLTDL